MKVSVVDKEGREVETLEISEGALGLTVHRDALRQAIQMYEANQRVGTASTKTRSEVSGSTRKLHPQKHTGHARMGDRKNPTRKGGGVSFGPKPRDYSYAIPKKVRWLALRSAYLSKFLDNQAVVINELKLDAPKTKQMAAILRALKIDRGCLIGIKDADESLWKSVRNLPRTELKPVQDINAYDLLLRKNLLLTKDALQAVLDRFSGASVAAKEATA